VAWVREEFDSLWHSPFAVELADAVVQDIQRLAVRSVIPDLDDWRDHPDPAAAVIESPVYRKGGRALGASEALREDRLRCASGTAWGSLCGPAARAAGIRDMPVHPLRLRTA
jgi:hypothetical protein